MGLWKENKRGLHSLAMALVRSVLVFLCERTRPRLNA